MYPQVLLEVGARDVIANDVYEYWAAKRRRWGKPILRRLQAPTSASDTNPFNVFRRARAEGDGIACAARCRALLLPFRATLRPRRAHVRPLTPRSHPRPPAGRARR